MSRPNRLRAVRVSRGVTIQGLARVAGVSRQTIYDAERSDHDPDVRTLRKLAAALGVTVADLLTDELEAAGGATPAAEKGR